MVGSEGAGLRRGGERCGAVRRWRLLLEKAEILVDVFLDTFDAVLLVVLPLGFLGGFHLLPLTLGLFSLTLDY
jgi:hypothetical protein